MNIKLQTTTGTYTLKDAENKLYWVKEDGRNLLKSRDINAALNSRNMVVSDYIWDVMQKTIASSIVTEQASVAPVVPAAAQPSQRQLDYISLLEQKYLRYNGCTVEQMTGKPLTAPTTKQQASQQIEWLKIQFA